jgi:ribonuclease HII
MHISKQRYLKPEFEIDFLHDQNPYTRVIGIDEVGRGCWAGPVAVGAFFYDLNSEFVFGVTDSKKLTPTKRDLIHAQLSGSNHEISYGNVEMIDKYGIGKTVEKLILRMVNKYNDGSTLFLIDGRFSQEFGTHSRTVIRGDSQYYCIAAASVLAKVERDSLMTRLENEYTGYRFDMHKGYGTKLHMDALSRLGVSTIHRRSYKPVALLLK